MINVASKLGEDKLKKLETEVIGKHIDKTVGIDFFLTHYSGNELNYTIRKNFKPKGESKKEDAILLHLEDVKYRRLWENQILVDVNFEFSNNDFINNSENDYKRKAHKVILAKNSKFFHNLFVEDNDSYFTFVVEEEASYFIKVIDYMYFGEIKINTITDLAYIKYIANKYEIESLIMQLDSISKALLLRGNDILVKVLSDLQKIELTKRNEVKLIEIYNELTNKIKYELKERSIGLFVEGIDAFNEFLLLLSNSQLTELKTEIERELKTE